VPESEPKAADSEKLVF